MAISIAVDAFQPTVHSIESWGDQWRPKNKNLHWQDGRSALELARAWFPSANLPTLPCGFADLLASDSRTANLRITKAAGECPQRFDNQGSDRKCDLQLTCGEKPSEAVISIEAKAWEAFGTDSVGKALTKHADAERVQGLSRLLLGGTKPLELKELRECQYQLMHATAGAVVAALEEGAPLAVFVVMEFLPVAGDGTFKNLNNSEVFVEWRQVKRNGRALRSWARILSGRRDIALSDGRLCEIKTFNNPGGRHGRVTLLMGKIRIATVPTWAEQ